MQVRKFEQAVNHFEIVTIWVYYRYEWNNQLMKEWGWDEAESEMFSSLSVLI